MSVSVEGRPKKRARSSKPPPASGDAVLVPTRAGASVVKTTPTDGHYVTVLTEFGPRFTTWGEILLPRGQRQRPVPTRMLVQVEASNLPCASGGEAPPAGGSTAWGLSVSSNAIKYTVSQQTRKRVLRDCLEWFYGDEAEHDWEITCPLGDKTYKHTPVHIYFIYLLYRSWTIDVHLDAHKFAVDCICIADGITRDGKSTPQQKEAAERSKRMLTEAIAKTSCTNAVRRCFAQRPYHEKYIAPLEERLAKLEEKVNGNLLE